MAQGKRKLAHRSCGSGKNAQRQEQKESNETREHFWLGQAFWEGSLNKTVQVLEPNRKPRRPRVALRPIIGEKKKKQYLEREVRSPHGNQQTPQGSRHNEGWIHFAVWQSWEGRTSKIHVASFSLWFILVNLLKVDQVREGWPSIPNLITVAMISVLALYSRGQAKPTSLISRQGMYLRPKFLHILVQICEIRRKTHLRSFSHDKLGPPNFWTSKIQHLTSKTSRNLAEMGRKCLKFWTCVSVLGN